MNKTKIIEWLLRVGVSTTFIIHGTHAMIGDQQWLSWIMNFTGMDITTGAQTLFLVGLLDVTVGIIIFFKPIRVVLLWAVLWTAWTATMRLFPFVNEPMDFIEELIVPTSVMALFVLRGWPKNLKEWFR